MASMQEIGMAVSLYELDNGQYPQSLQGLLTQPGGAANWNGPYLEDEDLPVDPWGNPFVYRYPGSRGPKFYDLKSLGPDGTESGDDIKK